MPASVSGNGGHNAAFSVAMVLLQGFDLSMGEARSVFADYNQRCEPPWNDKEIEHKLTQADKQDGFSTSQGLMPRGYLRDQGGTDDRESAWTQTLPARKPKPKAEYCPETLKRVAGAWSRTVDLLWLANRSPLDPALVGSADFLSALYKPGEKVLTFNKVNKRGQQYTQGEALWPDEAAKVPRSGRCGVWYLCQPVSGDYMPNPRVKANEDGSLKTSRRIEECVTDWRFLVLESDEAPTRLWLGALVQLPLRIAAIYTSGGRSVHALVRVDAATKAAWDDHKHSILDGLVKLGADRQAMSAVRLTRLPGALREGKAVCVSKEADEWEYEQFETPALQKLLYLNPAPALRTICDMLTCRDIEADWLGRAEALPDTDDGTGLAAVRAGLDYYANVSAKCRAALQWLEGRQ
jgi:hypothetical protein